MLRLGNANTSICATLALYIFRPRKGQAMRLNRDIRYQIYALLVAGHKQKAIAKQIGISEGGLSKEISRNGGCRKYDPEKSIDLRPAIVDKKYRFGDFEIDLINGARHKKNLFTANDRMSGFCILEPLATKDATDLANTPTRTIPGSEARTRT